MTEKLKTAKVSPAFEASGQVKFLISAVLFLSYVLVAVARNGGDV